MELIGVEVAYAEASKQKIVFLRVPVGTTAQQAVERSAMVYFFPHLDLKALDLGIFSLPCAPDYVLQEGDRVEIYRPLLCDPKEMRRKRAGRTRS